MIIEIDCYIIPTSNIGYIVKDGETEITVYDTRGGSITTFYEKDAEDFLKQYRLYTAFINAEFHLRADSLYRHLQLSQNIEAEHLKQASQSRGPEQGQ